MSRPEEVAPPEVFYDATEAGKYLHSTRMIDVQSQMAERAVEMLCLPEGRPCMILDVGCGTGLAVSTHTDTRMRARQCSSALRRQTRVIRVAA